MIALALSLVGAAGVFSVIILAIGSTGAALQTHRINKARRADPELSALKAERVRPLRERRPYAKIDAEAKAIVNARLERAVGR